MWGNSGLWDVHSPCPSRAMGLILQGRSLRQAPLLSAHRKAGACSRVRPVLACLEKGWGIFSYSLGVRDGGAPLLVNHVRSYKTTLKIHSVHCPSQHFL